MKALPYFMPYSSHSCLRYCKPCFACLVALLSCLVGQGLSFDVVVANLNSINDSQSHPCGRRGKISLGDLVFTRALRVGFCLSSVADTAPGGGASRRLQGPGCRHTILFQGKTPDLSDLWFFQVAKGLLEESSQRMSCGDLLKYCCKSHY